MKSHSADAAAVALLVAIITILFSDVLFLGNNFYLRDVALQYYPIRRVLHDLVRAGELPFWNPRVSGGQPLAANPAYETFYPFQWPIFLPDFDFGFRWTIVSHFYIAAIGTYALLRRLRTRIAPALFGAITFCLGGMFLSLTNLLPFLFSAAWLPWIALFWRRTLDDRRPSDFALTALALGMLLLAADQSMILQAGGLIVAYGIYHAAHHGQSVRRAATASVIVIAAAIFVGSAQLFPALDHQADSSRSEPIPLPVASTWSLGPQRPLELLFPNLDSWYSKELTVVWSRRSHPEFPLPLILNYYPGLLAGVLMLAGLIRRIRGWQFVAALGLISYLLALGRYGPLFRVFHLAIHSIRSPEKFFISAVFVFSVFAAVVADELDRNPALMRTSIAIAGCLAAISIALYSWAHSTSYAQLFAALWKESNPLFITASRRGWLLSMIMAATLAGILLAQTRIGNRAYALLGLFVLIDLGMRVDGLAPRIERGYYDPPPVARALAAQGRPIRIYNDADKARQRAALPSVPLRARLWAIRNGMIPRMEEIWGFGGMFEEDLDLTTLRPTRDLTRIFRELAATRPERAALLLAFSSVSHIGLLQIPNPPQDVREYNYVRVAAFPGNERFYFADQLIPLGALQSQQSISRRAAIVDIAPFQPQFGRIDDGQERSTRIALDVACAGPAFLVIAITPHKYWRAIVDGRDATLRRANVGFQGLVLPAGRHRIELVYRNPLVIACAIISLVSILALATIAVASALRNRALQPPSQR